MSLGALYHSGQRKSNLQNVTTHQQFISKHYRCEFLFKVVEPYVGDKNVNLSMDVGFRVDDKDGSLSMDVETNKGP